MNLKRILEKISASAGRRVNSTRNVTVSLAVSIFSLILSFFSRTVFINKLSAEYLGLSGLFSNILSFLFLSELGIGNAFSFALYKPLKDGDKGNLSSIMALFRKLYHIVGMIILVTGLLITPFLSFFLKNEPENIPDIQLYFVVMVVGTALSFLFSYKRILLISDQKEYISNLIFGIFRFLAAASQIIILLYTGSYFWYLIAMIGCGLMENLTAAYVANILYPFLSDKNPAPLSIEDRKELKKNTFAIFMHKIGGTLVFSSDNIIISKYVGLIPIGLYSNYALIITSIDGILNKAMLSLTASIGNLMTSSDSDYQQKIFSHVLLLNCWIYGAASVCLLCLMEPFLNLWIGSNYLLENTVLILAILSFYITGIRKTLLIFKDASGIFTQDKYKPLIEGLVNILVSIPLAIHFGIQGVILGTIISTLCVAFWFEAFVFFRNRFHRGFGEYLFVQLRFILLNFIIASLCCFLCKFINLNPLWNLLVRIPICLIVPSFIYLVIFRKTESFAYFQDLISPYIKKFGIRLGQNPNREV